MSCGHRVRENEKEKARSVMVPLNVFQKFGIFHASHRKRQTQNLNTASNFVCFHATEYE